MNQPNVTALADLKAGDIFQFADLRDSNIPAGELIPQWKVVSIGDPFCTATLEKSLNGAESSKSDPSPRNLAPQTSVMHFALGPR
jgi:hypothetical protein